LSGANPYCSRHTFTIGNLLTRCRFGGCTSLASMAACRACMWLLLLLASFASSPPHSLLIRLGRCRRPHLGSQPWPVTRPHSEHRTVRLAGSAHHATAVGPAAAPGSRWQRHSSSILLRQEAQQHHLAAGAEDCNGLVWRKLQRNRVRTECSASSVLLGAIVTDGLTTVCCCLLPSHCAGMIVMAST
jgi:hypothetical protein